MKNFIYGSSNGVHIIDLTKTCTQLTAVKEELADLHVNGKKVLFVATKLQSRDAFSKLANGFLVFLQILRLSNKESLHISN